MLNMSIYIDTVLALPRDIQKGILSHFDSDKLVRWGKSFPKLESTIKIIFEDRLQQQVDLLNKGKLRLESAGIHNFRELVKHFGPYCAKIEALDISRFTPTDNDVSIDFPSLKKLKLTANQKIKDISFCKNFPNLEVLELKWCTSIEDFNPLKECTKIKTANFLNCTGLHDIDFLEDLSELEELNVQGCPVSVSDSLLSKLKKIEQGGFLSLL
jgi:Leucine-rich repeat (LRR) protein